MKRGAILKQLKIDKIGYGGVGIGRLDNGKKVLVKGALPGSIVDCRVVKKKRAYLQAHITQIHQADRQRLDGEAVCPHYSFAYNESDTSLPKHKQGCGGCKRQVVSYASQLRLKQRIVDDCFQSRQREYGELPLLEILPAPSPFQYRNKIEFSFGKYIQRELPGKRKEIQEHWQLGFHRQGMFSKIVDIDQCFLISERAHRVYKKLKYMLASSGLPVHDQKTHQGLLRHLVVREGVCTEQILVNLVIASQHFVDYPADQPVWEELLVMLQQDAELIQQITSLVVTHNNGLADVVKGPEIRMETVWGEARIFEELHLTNQDADEIVTRFQVSPFSFFQTNTLGAEQLFMRAAKVVGSVSGNLIDLYCGGGAIGQSFLKLGLGERLIGVEIVDQAVKDAYFNAEINGIQDRVAYFTGKAERIVKQGAVKEDFLIGGDVLIVDPPREGLHKDVVTFLGQLYQQHPYRLLYVSCNPTTMLRDIMLLAGSGLHLQLLQPVDMFPQTPHIELIGLIV